MNLYDSSALLCYLRDEPGGSQVLAALDSGTNVCSAVNWSETAQKVLRAGHDWNAARRLLLRGFDLEVEPVLVEDAERVAQLWAEAPSLSLADRLCLATGQRLGAAVWTCDTEWGTAGRIRQAR